MSVFLIKLNLFVEDVFNFFVFYKKMIEKRILKVYEYKN